MGPEITVATCHQGALPMITGHPVSPSVHAVVAEILDLDRSALPELWRRHFARQSPMLTTEWLIANPLPADWGQQRARLAAL